MCTFVSFEFVVVLLCVAAVFLFSTNGSFFTSAVNNDRVACATPDAQLSLFWMRRALMQPYRAWYLHDKDAYETVPQSSRLPHSAVVHGHILFPLHVFYLRLCGRWLQWTQPRLALLLTAQDTSELLHRAEEVQMLRQVIAAVAAVCVVLIGAPASWQLSRSLTRLLTRAVREREKVARVQLPAAVYEAYIAAAESWFSTAADTQKDNKGIGRATSPNEHPTATFLGALLIVSMGLLPLLVMEVSTLQPWCFVGSLFVWAVYAVLQDELQLHASEADTCDEAFDLTTPIVEEGVVVCFALKEQPSLRPLVTYTVLVTLLSFTLTSCLYVTPLFYFWALTSCWQHGYKRVLVKMKTPATDILLRVGYSCYNDKLFMNTCFCYASASSVLTVLLLTTPWWWGQQPLLSFMDLFASPPFLSDAKTAAATMDFTTAAEAMAGRSFTGAGELHAHCLDRLAPYYTCALPAANVWRLSEWLGLQWTHWAKSLTRLFMSQDDYVNRESPRWLEFMTVVLVVLLNASSVLVFTFYRIRKPPLLFETPVRYAAERAAHQAEQQAYWDAKRLARHRVANASATGGGPSVSSSNTDAAGGDYKRTKVVTCLCREEYLVKQVVLFCWMLSLATASGTLLLMRSGPTSGVLMLTWCALLAAVYGIGAVLRRAHPLAFYPFSDAASAASTTATMPSAEEERKKESEKANATTERLDATNGKNTTKRKKENCSTPDSSPQDPSALTLQDCDNPRPLAASRWCTSAVAPSLTHVADVAWLLLAVLATTLSTGALTWPVVSPLVRQCVVVLLGGCVSAALWRLHRWESVDFTCSVLYTCGCAAVALLIMVIFTQLFPQTAELSYYGKVGYLLSFTNAFGDMYATTGETALRAFILQSAVACIMFVSCAVCASLRIGRLALEPEEVSLVPVESELSFFSKLP